MIYTIVKIRDQIKVYNDTERNLKKRLRLDFEVLEICRTEEIANARAKQLRGTTYKKPKKKRRFSPRRAYIQSKRMAGKGNIMYGKKHSLETRQKISKKGLGNKRKQGKKHSQRAKEIYKQQRRGWETIKKGSFVFHCPITGHTVRRFQCPPGYVHGFPEHIREQHKWVLYKYQQQKREADETNQQDQADSQ